jgi:hypothetical protein
MRDVIDHLEGTSSRAPADIETLFRSTTPATSPASWSRSTARRLQFMRAWSGAAATRSSVNPDRPFIADLDDLPLPKYDLLPLQRYLMPLIKGPFCFVVTSRGCPAGCTYCIKHVSYGRRCAALAGQAARRDHAASTGSASTTSTCTPTCSR